MVEINDNSAISKADQLISTLLSTKAVKVNRNEFLYKLFQNETDVEAILEDGPVTIVNEEQIRAIAIKLINDTTMKSSAASFVAGLPGGIVAFATIPADILQFYGMSTNLAQQLMYLYGYPDMYHDDNLTEEGKNTLIIFLGVMLGVSGANAAVKGLSQLLASQAVKKLPQKALTKTVYYPIIKKSLSVLGIKITKNSFAKSVSKVIPVVGGVISGGITMTTLKPMGKKLQTALHDGTYIIEVVGDIQVVESTPIQEEDPFESLKKTKELFDLGIIDEDEFTELKNKFFAKI